MYSIDTQKAIVKNTSGAPIEIDISNTTAPQIVPPDHTITTTPKPINEFDLVNKNEFDHLGSIIKEAENPKDYDRDFANRLLQLTPLYRIEDFLLYHYHNTPNKAHFLKHLEFHVLLHWMRNGITIQPQRDKFVRAWIDQVKQQKTNSINPDIPYLIQPFWEGENTPINYDLSKYEINKRGHVQINVNDEPFNVYQPVLAHIFNCSNLKVRNMDTLVDVEIDGLPYLETYIKGYHKGISYFDNDFKTLYSATNIEKFIEAIKRNYYDNREEKGGKEGWEQVKKFHPLVLTHSEINTVGYISGIVSRVEKIAKEHSRLFEMKTEKEKRTFENDFDKITPVESLNTFEYLKETAKEFIDRYPERLNKFLNEFEANEIDFVNQEVEYFENTLHDIENSESSHDGYSTTGFQNFNVAYNLCKEIGFEKFKYSTENKVKFLESKKAPQQSKTIKYFEETFNKLALKYKTKYEHDIPFGAYVFEDIKKDIIEKFETNTERLSEYQTQLHFWVNISLTDANLIGEPELTNRLIPLIKNEIDLLERKVSKPNQQTETKKEQETPTFTNNFDNIKPNDIYKHFKAGLVETGYLTEQELNEYLKAAFELKTKPETLFKLKHTPTKQKIYTVFYVYYKDISQKKHERQKEYAALLGDFFEGYKTKIIQTNWARDYKTKR